LLGKGNKSDLQFRRSSIDLLIDWYFFGICWQHRAFWRAAAQKFRPSVFIFYN
jgi:hypothetical protein